MNMYYKFTICDLPQEVVPKDVY